MTLVGLQGERIPGCLSHDDLEKIVGDEGRNVDRQAPE